MNSNNMNSNNMNSNLVDSRLMGFYFSIPEILPYCKRNSFSILSYKEIYSKKISVSLSHTTQHACTYYYPCLGNYRLFVDFHIFFLWLLRYKRYISGLMVPSCGNMQILITYFFLFIEYIRVTLVNKIIQVSDAQLHNTSSVHYCVLTTPNQVSVHHRLSPPYPPTLPSTLCPLGNPTPLSMSMSFFSFFAQSLHPSGGYRKRG